MPDKAERIFNECRDVWAWWVRCRLTEAETKELEELCQEI